MSTEGPPIPNEEIYSSPSTRERVHTLIRDIPQQIPDGRLSYLIGGNTVADLLLNEDSHLPLNTISFQSSSFVGLQQIEKTGEVNVVDIDELQQANLIDVKFQKLKTTVTIPHGNDRKIVQIVNPGILIVNGIRHSLQKLHDPDGFRRGSPLIIEDEEQIRKLLHLTQRDPLATYKWKDGVKYALDMTPQNTEYHIRERLRALEDEILQQAR